tara:strand:+ start:136427 stop:136885 length:459 start_codon:yes stop_codon:yes gene_type:complete
MMTRRPNELRDLNTNLLHPYSFWQKIFKSRTSALLVLAFTLLVGIVVVPTYGCGTSCETIDISPDAFPDGTVGTAYSLDLTSTSDCYWHSSSIADNLTFELSGGALPPGISVNSGGEVRGTPSLAGTYTFTLRLRYDARNLTVDRGYSMIVE